jgi:hypothetical protein
MRRSRQEAHAEARATEILDEFRKPEARAWLFSRGAEIAAARERERERRAERNAPWARLQRLEELKKKWERRKKLAATKLGKIAKRIKYYEGKVDVAAQPRIKP